MACKVYPSRGFGGHTPSNLMFCSRMLLVASDTIVNNANECKQVWLLAALASLCRGSVFVVASGGISYPIYLLRMQLGMFTAVA